jgi:hypothetical protein
VRGLPAEEVLLLATGGKEEALVLWLREEAHRGGNIQQQKREGCGLTAPSFGLALEGRGGGVLAAPTRTLGQII